MRLDETLQEPGDVLDYVYDYGDNWELTLRLEEVLPADADTHAAVVIAGRRAAPPEDSGGGTDLASIATVVDDPGHFDLEELNAALRGPYFLLREHDVHPRLVDLVNRLRYTSIGDDLAARTMTLVHEPTRPPDDDVLPALGAYFWFLDRAKGAGIQLTAAGYLKPADVEAASRVVPGMGDWIGKANRESLAFPLLDFRQSLQSIGLLRKYKGMLRLTRRGANAQRDPLRLWDLLAEKLIPTAGGYERDATLLLLAYAASSAGEEIPLEPIAQALTHLGWQHRDRRPLHGYELYRLDAWDTLTNVTRERSHWSERHTISPAAVALARAALRR